MNEELIKALKLALKNKGLSEELYEFINVENEGEVNAAVDKLFGMMPKPPTLDINKTLEQPEFKKELHRRITKAVNTYKANKGIDDDDDKPNPDDDDKFKDAPDYVKEILASNKRLEKEITDIKNGKVTETKQQQAAAAIKGSKIIPSNVQDKWLGRLDLNSETPFEEQLKGLETEYTEIVQAANNGRTYAGPPRSGDNKDAPSKEQMDAIVGNI